jgi:hypothetical protein
MNTVEAMVEFVNLWGLLQPMVLTDEPDKISWRWTSNGVYTAKSAYDVQFRGSYCSFNTSAIWKAQAEGKHRLFTWLLIQSKIQTADRLLARNWPCNPVCILCDQAWETAAHLCLHCVYAREVWVLVASWIGGGFVQVPDLNQTLEQWWNNSTINLPRQFKRAVQGILMYTTRHLWKDRNQRIFQGIASSPVAVFHLLKEDFRRRRDACGGDEWLLL